MLMTEFCPKHNQIYSSDVMCHKCLTEGFKGLVKPKRKIPYSEKLKDTRWQKKRLHVFNEAKWKCEECGFITPEGGLQVHHITYLTGVEPWDHPDEILMCLCSNCHKRRQESEQQFFYKVAQAIRYKSAEELKTMPVWYMFETKPFYEKDKK